MMFMFVSLLSGWEIVFGVVCKLLVMCVCVCWMVLRVRVLGFIGKNG